MIKSDLKHHELVIDWIYKRKKMGQEYDLQTENRFLAINKEEMVPEGFHYVDRSKCKQTQ